MAAYRPRDGGGSRKTIVSGGSIDADRPTKRGTMGKYFGTDGFRGEANVNLNAEHAFLVGRFFGALAAKKAAEAGEGARGSIVIGKDTRRSGDMFEHALAAGIVSSGADAHLLGVVTTPGVAYITRTNDFAFGIMVSASHNPYQDNGIKVLNANGEKLEDATVAACEAYLDGDRASVEYALRSEIGRVIDASSKCDAYAEFLISLAKKRFDGFKVALDCANGSAYALGKRVFEALGAQVTAISIEPNGENINVNCGSTHIGQLCQLVKDGDFDLGFAYDGDADRCLAVDENGNSVDGDQIMYVCGLHLKDEGRLANNTIVATIMSNFGLFKKLDELGVSYEKTAVGDKYVYENMSANGHSIGGEQSGHIIFREFATTGDGIMTSLMVMEAVMASGKKLGQLVEPLVIYPQVLKNVRVHDKATARADEAVKAAIAAAEESLGSTGRILVRESGTEPVIRVMAEAESLEECEKQVDAIIAVIAAQGHVVQ